MTTIKHAFVASMMALLGCTVDVGPCRMVVGPMGPAMYCDTGDQCKVDADCAPMPNCPTVVRSFGFCEGEKCKTL